MSLGHRLRRRRSAVHAVLEIPVFLISFGHHFHLKKLFFGFLGGAYQKGLMGLPVRPPDCGN